MAFAAPGRAENECVLCVLISVANLPPTQSTLPNQAAGSVFGYLNLGELVMGPAYLPDSKQEFPDVRDCLDEQPLRGDEFGDDETSDGLMSLLEENARLRGLVIKLTDIILKNVADRG